MSEADERFAGRLADDLAQRFGPSVAVLAVAIERDGAGTRMTTTCAAGGEAFEADASAENDLEAYERLRNAVIERRLGRAFERLVDS